MRRGSLCIAVICATVAVSFCSSAASAAVVVCCDPAGGDDGGICYRFGPDLAVWTYNRITVSPHARSWEYVDLVPDPTGQTMLCLTGKVVTGSADFWVNYYEDTTLCQTPVQHLARGPFDIQVCVPCVPSEADLCLYNTDQHHPLLIKPAVMVIQTSHTPEPATAALWVFAMTGALLRRRV
jgi:hypothetical protein